MGNKQRLNVDEILISVGTSICTHCLQFSSICEMAKSSYLSDWYMLPQETCSFAGVLCLNFTCCTIFS